MSRSNPHNQSTSSLRSHDENPASLRLSSVASLPRLYNPRQFPVPFNISRAGPEHRSMQNVANILQFTHDQMIRMMEDWMAKTTCSVAGDIDKTVWDKMERYFQRMDRRLTSLEEAQMTVNDTTGSISRAFESWQSQMHPLKGIKDDLGVYRDELRHEYLSAKRMFAEIAEEGSKFESAYQSLKSVTETAANLESQVKQAQKGASQVRRIIDQSAEDISRATSDLFSLKEKSYEIGRLKASLEGMDDVSQGLKVLKKFPAQVEGLNEALEACKDLAKEAKESAKHLTECKSLDLDSIQTLNDGVDRLKKLMDPMYTATARLNKEVMDTKELHQKVFDGSQQFSDILTESKSAFVTFRTKFENTLQEVNTQSLQTKNGIGQLKNALDRGTEQLGLLGSMNFKDFADLPERMLELKSKISPLSQTAEAVKSDVDQFEKVFKSAKAAFSLFESRCNSKFDDYIKDSKGTFDRVQSGFTDMCDDMKKQAEEAREGLANLISDVSMGRSNLKLLLNFQPDVIKQFQEQLSRMPKLLTEFLALDPKAKSINAEAEHFHQSLKVITSALEDLHSRHTAQIEPLNQAQEACARTVRLSQTVQEQLGKMSTLNAERLNTFLDKLPQYERDLAGMSEKVREFGDELGVTQAGLTKRTDEIMAKVSLDADKFHKLSGSTTNLFETVGTTLWQRVEDFSTGTIDPLMGHMASLKEITMKTILVVKSTNANLDERGNLCRTGLQDFRSVVDSNKAEIITLTQKALEAQTQISCLLTNDTVERFQNVTKNVNAIEHDVKKMRGLVDGMWKWGKVALGGLGATVMSTFGIFIQQSVSRAEN